MITVKTVTDFEEFNAFYENVTFDSDGGNISVSYQTMIRLDKVLHGADRDYLYIVAFYKTESLDSFMTIPDIADQNFSWEKAIITNSLEIALSVYTNSIKELARDYLNEQL